jgi:hypothetical protein
LRIEPNPTPEEAAAIAAALEALREEETEDRNPLNRSRWGLAGLLGHALPARMKLEGTLWSYASWEEMT